MAEQTYGDWIRSNPQLPTKKYKKEHMAQQNQIGDTDKMVTAVDVLWENLTSLFFFTDGIPIEAMDRYNQAKQMEKEQIIDAYKADRYPCSYEDAEEYYNDTYKTQAQ